MSRRFKVGEVIPVFIDGRLTAVTVAKVTDDDGWAGGQTVCLEEHAATWSSGAVQSLIDARATIMREAERIAAEMVARRKP